MADPLGTVEKIAKVALAIKQTVDTVRRNTRECREIRSRAVRVSLILSQLKETETMKDDPAAADTLEALEKALTIAHELVTDCQRKSVVCHFCSAGGQARQLREVKQDISDRMMDVVFAINAGMTTMLVSIQASLIHHPRKPDRGSAVPKFGAWDEKDPTTGVSYTAALNKVRDGKCITSATSHNRFNQGRKYGFSPDKGSAVPMFGVWEEKDPKSYSAVFNRVRDEKRITSATSHNRFNQGREYASSGAGALERSQSSRGSFEISNRNSLLSHFPGTKNNVSFTANGSPVFFSSISLSLLSMGSGGPIKFSLSTLEAATNAFSEEKIIGRGGSSTVYKGVLDGGLVVAIKKLHAPDEFLLGSRLERILKISIRSRHKNIVRLLGHCHERRKAFRKGEEQLLFVEEYITNGSLDRIFYGSKLNWYNYLQIIRGIADGLCYLHEADVIHVDLKLENILLDSDMSPKIADFGLSRFLPNSDKFVDVENFEGTLAYAAPEYIIAGHLSKKNDVYSFGIMVMEIICRMINRSKPLRGQASVKWAREALRSREYPSKSVPPEGVSATSKCLKMAMLCVSVHPDNRPSMRDVVELLKEEDTKM